MRAVRPCVRARTTPPSRIALAPPSRRFASSSAPAGYPGAERAARTTKLQFVSQRDTFPVYSVLDANGKVRSGAPEPTVSADLVREMYTQMVTVNVMDTILYDAQRQGRVSFYMTAFGEEAMHIGSAAGLELSDVIYAQYREQGVFLRRGFTLDDFCNQCFSNVADVGKGRQMPVHYGSAQLNIQTISSPLATQIPQASGAAYALKQGGKKNIVACYFGEGAASEGDFHPALNFAATLDCPVLFFCRNNGFAISTPSSEQYGGDGIAGRGPAYGIATARIDGNDIFAVLDATRAARKYAAENNKPVLIEAMTYRVGHHSTSDDSTRYRPAAEVQKWATESSPITRLRKYMEVRNWWDAKQEEKLLTEKRADVLGALQRAEERLKPPVADLFTDVYDKPLPHLLAQEAALHRHLIKHGADYPLADHVK